MGSPFYGSGYFSHLATHRDLPGRSTSANREFDDAVVAVCWWIAVYVVAGVFLYLAVLATFDRRVGRMTEERRRPPAPPPEPVPDVAEAPA